MSDSISYKCDDCGHEMEANQSVCPSADCLSTNRGIVFVKGPERLSIKETVKAVPFFVSLEKNRRHMIPWFLCMAASVVLGFVTPFVLLGILNLLLIAGGTYFGLNALYYVHRRRDGSQQSRLPPPD